MKSLLNSEYEIDLNLIPYKKCFYSISNSTLNYLILYPTAFKISEIKKGHEYEYYIIEGTVYGSLLTSDNINKKYPFILMDRFSLEISKPIQLTIFDEEKMEEVDD